MQPEKQGNKEVIVSFANAVARENNRRSVTAAQKAGRKAKANPPKTCVVTRASTKGKGRAVEVVEEVEEVEVIDARASGPSNSKALGGNRGRKRKAVDINTASGISDPVLEPRKLRKRA